MQNENTSALFGFSVSNMFAHYDKHFTLVVSSCHIRSSKSLYHTANTYMCPSIRQTLTACALLEMHMIGCMNFPKAKFQRHFLSEKCCGHFRLEPRKTNIVKVLHMLSPHDIFVPANHCHIPKLITSTLV